MDAQFLRQRAAWFRQLAGETIDELARSPMLVLAAEYERTAFALEEPTSSTAANARMGAYPD